MPLSRLFRRATVVLAALVIAAWLGIALLADLMAPFSLWAEALTPAERSFRGLPDSPAVPVLREQFGHGVTAADGRKLYDLVVERHYRRALEVGTARGYAAIWLGLAMKTNGGSVTTIDIDPAAAREAQENFRRAGLADVVESRVNDALREIPAINGEFDFVFLDLGGPHHKELLDLVLPRLSQGGAVVSHNAYLLRFTQPDYLQAIRNSSSLESRFLPTLTGGISITVKRAK